MKDVRSKAAGQLINLVATLEPLPQSLSYDEAGLLLYPDDPEGMRHAFDEAGTYVWPKLSEEHQKFEASLSFKMVVSAANKWLAAENMRRQAESKTGRHLRLIKNPDQSAEEISKQELPRQKTGTTDS
jgi:hypothetical protein